MASVAFIGLGRMGLQMANNLLTMGHAVTGFDLRTAQVSHLVEQGGRGAENPADAVREADFILTMLPDAEAVTQLYMADDHVRRNIRKSAIVVDCSTIGIQAARAVAAALESAGLTMCDAPCIGDARDARVRLLTFAVGGGMAAFTEARAVLSDMGERVIYCGRAGSGQAAVLATQMMTAANVIAAAEAFALAEREGLAAEKLFEVASMSTASSWALIEHCPQAGLVPAAPSNNLYQATLKAETMLAYLRLAEESGKKLGARTPVTSQAVDLMAEFCDTRDPRLDFSAIIQVLRQR